MGTLSTTDVQNGQTTDAAIMNNNFTNVKTVVNGGIDNSNVASGANIALNKLAAAGVSAGTAVGLVGSAWAASGGVAPTGCVLDYGGAAAPDGWLLCDGTAVSRATYSALFGVISDVYGVGDGSTTFNLPDCRGRTTVGVGTHADVDARGENDGEAVGSRRPKHKHSLSETTTGAHTHGGATGTDSPTHTHDYFIGSGEFNVQAGADNLVIDNIAASTTGGVNQLHTHSISSDGNHTHSITVGPQTTVPTDAPAYITFNKIIKT